MHALSIASWQRSFRVAAALVIGLVVPAVAPAQISREEFSRFVAQSQRDPNDWTIRSYVVAQGARLKPPPAIPDAARDAFVRGTTIVRGAQNPDEQRRAVEAFNEATNSAPWWADAYYNLAVAQELAGMLNLAKRSLVLYFGSGLDPAEARAVRDRVAAIGAKEELLHAQAASGSVPTEKFLDAMEGAFFFCGNTEPGVVLIIQVSGRRLNLLHRMETRVRTTDPLVPASVETRWESSVRSAYMRREGLNFVDNDVPENTVRLRATELEYRDRRVAVRCNRMKANSSDLPPRQGVLYSFGF